MRGDCWGTWLIMLGFMDLGWPRVYRRSTSVLFNFLDSPVFKEDMNIYVMQSQSFCEDIYVTPKCIWSWDWRDMIVVRINLSLDTHSTEYTWWSLQSLASTEISVSDAHSVYMVLLSWQIKYPSVQYLGHLFVLKSMPLGRLWAIE